MISFCTRGTCSNGSSSPRSPRATITPCATPQDLASGWRRRRPLDLRDDRHRPRHVPPCARPPDARRLRVCTKLSATRSTPSFRPNSQVAGVLRRQRRCRQGDAGRVDALVRAERRAVHDDGRELGGRPSGDSQLDPPVVQQQAVARLRRANQLAERRVDPSGASRRVAFGDPQLVARLAAESERRRPAAPCGSWARSSPA